eukprot:363244-Pelagomonas_calceolata.AAC.5
MVDARHHPGLKCWSAGAVKDKAQRPSASIRLFVVKEVTSINCNTDQMRLLAREYVLRAVI